MAVHYLRGRIQQLRDQLKTRSVTLEDHTIVQAAIRTIAERYFQSALPFVEQQIAIAVLRDNSLARRKAEATIRHMAFYDLLTDLPNRRLLEDRLQQAIVSAQRHRTVGAVLFIDLDKFKQVNDEQGHEAGDWLLQQVAHRMRSVLRESDTAARFGGDEFVVLLPEVLDAASAAQVAEKIRLQMQAPFVMDGGVALHIDSSIGVVLFPQQADTVDEILRFGDDAMYTAKRQGRNRVAVFNP